MIIHRLEEVAHLLVKRLPLEIYHPFFCRHNYVCESRCSGCPVCSYAADCVRRAERSSLLYLGFVYVVVLFVEFSNNA